MKKIFLSILILTGLFTTVRADEGMWLPQLLGSLNESRMQELGMKISAEDIYSINKGSLKDAIVSFGGFCTGEVISTQGLVLTNHHCGYRAIQSHSTMENNYLEDGFWATTKKDELPNQGLFVTFVNRIDDVTAQILNGTHAQMSEKERQSIINKNMADLQKSIQKEDFQNVLIRSFFEGNQYYAFIIETFRDVRLVGAPPSSIGKYGKDSDNWVWPRHTGDFAMFRIYADKNNKPSEYSEDNIPYTPKKALSISLSGVAQDDFTMIFGFPGRTMQYLPSAAVDQIVRVNDPTKIMIRDKALAQIDQYMRTDPVINIQYAAKYSGISNSWKKWQGEVLGLKRTNAVAKKLNYEEIFQGRVNKNPEFAAYRNILPEFNRLYTEIEPYSQAQDYYLEIMSKLELFNVANQLNAVANAYKNGGQNAFETRINATKSSLTAFFKDYNEQVDQSVFAAMFEVYLSQKDPFVAGKVKFLFEASGKDYKKLTHSIFSESYLSQEAEALKLLDLSGEEFVKVIDNSAAIALQRDMLATFQREVQSKTKPLQEEINALQRDYTRAQLAVMTEKKFYPDANSTMRVAYGKVDGYTPQDAVYYHFVTDLDGVMEKYKPGDYEYDLPEKLVDLFYKKDYGIYESKGSVPVCFIASNHTTGGNSGSPALDAYGNLIGLNFDRVWEGTMSDINFDESICRNIMVDIRYVLFITDKFAGATHLIDEMDLVYPKNK